VKSRRPANPVSIQSAPVWGPEPIGAAAQDALDAMIGSHVQSPAVIAPGFWPTSDSTYVQPETFTAQGALRSPPIATQGEGLPAGMNALPPDFT
jgi:hypothetical protein